MRQKQLAAAFRKKCLAAAEADEAAALDLPPGWWGARAMARAVLLGDQEGAVTSFAWGTADRPALFRARGTGWEPHAILFARYITLCADCRPQVYASERLLGGAVTVEPSGRVWVEWQGDALDVGTFDPGATDYVQDKLASEAVRVCVAGGTFMADEDEVTPAAQAAALGRAEEDMRYMLPDDVVAGMATLRFEAGTDEHAAMVAAVKEGRPSQADLKAEAHAETWEDRDLPRTEAEVAARIARIDALAASMPWWNK